MYGKFEDKVYSSDDNWKIRVGTGGLTLVGATATIEKTIERGYVDPRIAAIGALVTAVAAGGYYLMSKVVLGQKAEH